MSRADAYSAFYRTSRGRLLHQVYAYCGDGEVAQRALAERLNRTQEVDEGTVLVTIGAGDVFRLGEALATEAPAEGSR